MLVIGIADRAINKFVLNSLREAENMKDFLDETGEYRRVDIYEMRKAEGTFTELRQIEQAMR